MPNFTPVYSKNCVHFPDVARACPSPRPGSSLMHPPTWETGHQQSNEDIKALSHFMTIKRLTTLIYSLLSTIVVKIKFLSVKKGNMS